MAARQALPAWIVPLAIFMAGQVVTAAGVYAAIRADLREALIEAHIAVKRADEAHQRIDRIQEKR